MSNFTVAACTVAACRAKTHGPGASIQKKGLWCSFPTYTWGELAQAKVHVLGPCIPPSQTLSQGEIRLMK